MLLDEIMNQNNNLKYTLIVKIKKKIESYYSDNISKLEEYAEFRKFTEYKIYELKEVKGSDAK